MLKICDKIFINNIVCVTNECKYKKHCFQFKGKILKIIEIDSHYNQFQVKEFKGSGRTPDDFFKISYERIINVL